MRMTGTAGARFPLDARMPELARALDGATVGGLLRGYLSAARQQSVDVQHCKVVRLRYRPEERCVLQYAVTVRDPGTRASRRELVTGILYGDPDRAARRAARRPGAAFIPDLRMMVHVFPFDRSLPQAATVASAGDQDLRAAVLRSFGPGSWRVEGWSNEVVRYREGLSLVVRYTVTASHAGSRTEREQIFYAKAYPEQDAARRAFTALEQLALHSASSGLGVRVEGPIACIDRLNCVLFRATAGRPLDEMLGAADEGELLAAIESTGRAVARFNMSQVPVARTFSAADYLQSLRRPVTILAHACPEVTVDVCRVLDAVRGIADGGLHPTHRDMKPEHVLVTPGGLTFIDLDSCALAEPVLDAALMLARFEGLALAEAKRARLRSMSAAFTRAYLARVPETWRARLPVYFAASLLEVAAGLFHRQEDGWRQNIPQLIATARTVLPTIQTRL